MKITKRTKMIIAWSAAVIILPLYASTFFTHTPAVKHRVAAVSPALSNENVIWSSIGQTQVSNAMAGTKTTVVGCEDKQNTSAVKSTFTLSRSQITPNQVLFPRLGHGEWQLEGKLFAKKKLKVETWNNPAYGTFAVQYSNASIELSIVGNCTG
jgi:hypothetical protein